MNVDGLGIAVAFSAGRFSFLSPCVLPLFPYTNYYQVLNAWALAFTPDRLPSHL